MKRQFWFPLAAVAVVTLGLYLYVYFTPLPANGYGREIYDVHTTLAVPANSSITVPIGGEQDIPEGSLIVLTAGVMNERLNSDLSEDALFRLTYAGTTLEEEITNVISRSFETRVDTRGFDNPRLFVRNDHPFPLEVDYRAFVWRPPTTPERFLMYAPIILFVGLLASVWLILSLLLRDSRGRVA